MDLIDRNAILNRYQVICNGTDCMDCPFYFYVVGCAFEKLILDSVVVDAEPVKHGHWIKKDYAYAGIYRYECSECHHYDEHSEGREVPYCWQCGALMDEVQE